MIKCFFTLIVIFSIAITGCWGCQMLDIGVGTSRTGNTVAGKPEWTVVITNRCDCPVGGISLSCPDFNTVEPVDPSIMLRSGDGRCLINHGAQIAPASSVQFSYAWDSSFAFVPRDFNPSC